MVHITHSMEITTTTTDQNPRRQAVVSALAIVGFIVLILLGIGLAIYAARYVPVAFERMGTGAVSLSSIFTPAEEEAEPEVDVVVTETTIPFEPVATTTDSSVPTYTPPATGNTTTYVPPTTITVPVTIPPPAPYGRADLTVDITAVGYCTRTDPDSFRRSNDVPDGEYGGFQFRVTNIGTNNSGSWDFTYDLPTSPALERSARGKELGPGDRVDYTLCFTEARSGNNRTIRVEVDSDDDVNESNENNNSDSAQIDIDN